MNAVDHADLDGTLLPKCRVPALVPVFVGLPCLSPGVASFPRC